MTAPVRHYHHRGQSDDLVIVGYAGDDPSSGVVRVRNVDGVVFAEIASAIEPWRPTSTVPTVNVERLLVELRWLTAHPEAVALLLPTGTVLRDKVSDGLGLTDEQADELFAPTNTLADLWRIASDITDGAIQVPAELTESEVS
jgi:hypothetical protein